MGCLGKQTAGSPDFVAKSLIKDPKLSKWIADQPRNERTFESCNRWPNSSQQSECWQEVKNVQEVHSAILRALLNTNYRRSMPLVKNRNVNNDPIKLHRMEKGSPVNENVKIITQLIKIYLIWIGVVWLPGQKSVAIWLLARSTATHSSAIGLPSSIKSIEWWSPNQLFIISHKHNQAASKKLLDGWLCFHGTAKLEIGRGPSHLLHPNMDFNSLNCTGPCTSRAWVSLSLTVDVETEEQSRPSQATSLTATSCQVGDPTTTFTFDYSFLYLMDFFIITGHCNNPGLTFLTVFLAPGSFRPF